MSVTTFENSTLPSNGNTKTSRQNASKVSEETLLWNPATASSIEPIKGSRRSIRQQDIAEVTSQLAIMTRSGIDVASALTSLASQCKRPALAQVLSEVNEAVLTGNTLSDALRQHSDVFDASYIATIAAGEASGKMSEVLAQLAQMQSSTYHTSLDDLSHTTHDRVQCRTCSTRDVCPPSLRRYFWAIQRTAPGNHTTPNRNSRRTVESLVAMGTTRLRKLDRISNLAQN